MAQHWTLVSLLLVALWTPSSSSEPPVQITYPATDTVQVPVGDSVTFTCEGESNGQTRELAWYSGTSRLYSSSEEGYIITKSTGDTKIYTTLTIRHVSFENDYDLYTCKSDASQEDTVLLRVIGGWVRIEGYVEEEDGRLWIECRVTQGSSVEWLKDGKLVSTTEPGVGILTQEDREKGEAVSTLMVDMQAEYGGEYTCRDVNHPSTQDTATISQPTSPAPTPAPRQRIDITRENFNVTEGEMFSIECRGNMNASLFWTHNDARLLPGHDVIMMTTMTTSGEQVTSVSIMSASIRWAGNYSCMDHLDLTNQDSVHVTVIRNTSADRLRITTEKFVQVTPGGEFSIRCQAGPRASLFWTHDDLPVVPGAGLVVMTTMTTSGQQVTAVTVTAVDKQRAGVYACRDYRDNTNGDSVTVSVQPKKVVAAVRILSPDTDVNVEEGEPFTLICAGAASTRPTWYFNDQPLGYQPNLLVTNTIDFITLDLVVILTRLSPDTSASGVYSCRDMGDGEANVQRRVTVNPKEG